MVEKRDKTKIYVLDTSSIIETANCIEELGRGGNIVVLPYQVLRELDKHSKSKNYSLSFSARVANRLIDKIADQEKFFPDVKSAFESKTNSFPNGGKLAWCSNTKEDLEKYEHVFLGEAMDPDDKILITALKMRDDFSGIETILIAEDRNFRLRAKCKGLKTQKLRLGKIDINAPSQLYCGFEELFVPGFLIDKFLKSGEGLEKYLEIDDVKNAVKKSVPKLIWNQGVKLIDDSKNNRYVLATVNLEERTLDCLKYSVYFDPKSDVEFDTMKIKPKQVCGMIPGDPLQILYMEYLLNPKIELVAVNGKFGTGKTRLLVAGALENLFSGLNSKTDFDSDLNEAYSNGFVIIRPEYLSSDYDHGYLPGSLGEKIEPFLKPYYQSLSGIAKLLNRKNLVNELEKSNLLNWEATAYLRGQDYSDVIVSMDETQNGPPALAVLFCSRFGEGSKTIVSGDLSQIDNRYVDYNNNALTLMTEAIRKRNAPENAAITLTVNYRKGVSRITETLFEMLNGKK